MEGEIKAQVSMIEKLLQEGVEWPVIERVSGLDETQFNALKQHAAEMNR